MNNTATRLTCTRHFLLHASTVIVQWCCITHVVPYNLTAFSAEEYVNKGFKHSCISLPPPPPPILLLFFVVVQFLCSIHFPSKHTTFTGIYLFRGTQEMVLQIQPSLPTHLLFQHTSAHTLALASEHLATVPTYFCTYIGFSIWTFGYCSSILLHIHWL